MIKPGNPRISTQAWADTLEQGIVMNMLEREELRKQIEEEKRQEAEHQQKVLKYNRWWMEVCRELKRMPEASDPNSEIGTQVLAMKRELRKLRGRPRSDGKGGGGRASVRIRVRVPYHQRNAPYKTQLSKP